MSGMMSKLRPKKQLREWTTTGSFVNKPRYGWLHPDEQLHPHAGVCYGVRYIGCMHVKESMKSLDFDTRTNIAKECISKVCDSAGLKTASKKSKRTTKVKKYLADSPHMTHAGSNINLTITTDSIMLTVMESGEVIGNHLMPSISFASGGDADTLDFVAYVAKDEINNRACHVFECGGGLAQDVITTLGQAFELRFKQHLEKRPEAVTFPSRLEEPILERDAWGNDEDRPEDVYYNDMPGAKPPSPSAPMLPPEYSTPTSNLPINHGTPVGNERQDVNLIDFNPTPSSRAYDNTAQNHQDLVDLTSQSAGLTPSGDAIDPAMYDNSNSKSFKEAAASMSYRETEEELDVAVGGVTDGAVGGQPSHLAPVSATAHLDSFDMQPFCYSIPEQSLPDDGARGPTVELGSPYNEPWFHGRLVRKECDGLLLVDGDFLVRESKNTDGQYVLSGRNGGKIRHLLLIDPDGVVKTRDRTFDSVSHLVDFHMSNKLPITSSDSELILKKPIKRIVS